MPRIATNRAMISDEIAARTAEMRDYYFKIGWTTWADREARLVASIEAGEPISVPGWEAGLGPHRHDIVVVEADGSIRL